MLDDSYSTVFTLPSTPPTPSIAPPTRLAIVPPSDTSVLLEGSTPTATGGPNAAGNLPEGGSDFSTLTIPSATLLATYTGAGGGAASSATGSGAVETLQATGGGWWWWWHFLVTKRIKQENGNRVGEGEYYRDDRSCGGILGCRVVVTSMRG
jgi:hypothetical protein